MDNFIIKVYKNDRFKLQQDGDHIWYPAKYLQESAGHLLPCWQEQYARMLIERSNDYNIVGVIKNNTDFTVINLSRFLRPIDKK
jgi:hypothetical protein